MMIRIFIPRNRKTGKIRKPHLAFTTVIVVEDEYPHKPLYRALEFWIGWIIVEIQIPVKEKLWQR